MAEKSWQNEIDQYDHNIAHNIDNISILDSEIGFRNAGLVEREPTGTTLYVDPMQEGNGSSPTNAYRYLYQFTNVARSPGDVCICRRVRGGFNTNDSIFINRYSRYKWTNAENDNDLTVANNYNGQRDVGYLAPNSGQVGKGSILAWKQGDDDYGHGNDKNRSGTQVEHAQKHS